jgi:hypothetical protein
MVSIEVTTSRVRASESFAGFRNYMKNSKKVSE